MQIDRHRGKVFAGILKSRASKSFMSYDAADVDAVLTKIDRCWIGQGQAKDPAEAARLAIEDLGTPLEQVEGVVISVSGSSEKLNLGDVETVGETVDAATGESARVLTGGFFFDPMGDGVEVTLIAVKYDGDPPEGFDGTEDKASPAADSVNGIC